MQSSTDAHDVLHALPWHVYGAQSLVLPVTSRSVWMSTHVTADTHRPMPVSQIVWFAQSELSLHLSGHVRFVPSHWYASHLGEGPRGRGVHVPYHVTWQLEEAELPDTLTTRVRRLDRLGQLPAVLRTLR